MARLAVIIMCLAHLVGSIASAHSPLTPILGVWPSSLDFGTVPVDSTVDLQVILSNDVDDSGSFLVVDSLTIGGYAFSLPTPPTLPIVIPGDGSTVPLTVRFSPPWPVVPSATLAVTAENAANPHSSIPIDGDGALDIEIPSGSIMGYDQNGIPLVCGTGVPDNLGPPSSRGWECIPSVIQNNGTSVFLLEVDVKGEVASVHMTNISLALVPPPSLSLRDDGLGFDRIANDFIFTSGTFRYNTSFQTPIQFFGPGNDPASPDGLKYDIVGRVVITETDMTTTEFLEWPQIGFLRTDIQLTTVTGISSMISASPHLINIRTSGRETQRGLRVIGGDPSLLTNVIYEEFQDAADFFVFLSTDKVEALPRLAGPNYKAGDHIPVQVNYSGTGLPSFDNTSMYGSNGLLLGISRLDIGNRGLNSLNAVHELEHQWGAFVNASLGIREDTPHYLSRSSVGSLIGGQRWIDNENGTFILDCTEGRGSGAYHASPLDKYLMGLIPAASVAPIHVDDDIVFPEDCGTLITQAEIDRTATMQDIQGIHGVRWPGPLSAQRTFTLAFVVESHDRLLNPTEMTFYEILAEHHARILAPEVPDPYVAGSNWVPLTRFFGEGTTWRTDFPFLPPIGVPNVTWAPPNSPTLDLATPNPVTVATEIHYWLSSRQMVHLDIYDVHGRIVRRLVRASEDPGYHVIYWNVQDHQGRRVPSGVYYYRLQAGDWEAARPVIVLK